MSRAGGAERRCRAAALTVLKICRPSWPPDTKIRPSNTVTPVALRLTLISVTTLHLRRNHGESYDRKSLRWAPPAV